MLSVNPPWRRRNAASPPPWLPPMITIPDVRLLIRKPHFAASGAIRSAPLTHARKTSHGAPSRRDEFSEPRHLPNRSNNPRPRALTRKQGRAAVEAKNPRETAAGPWPAQETAYLPRHRNC